MSEFEEPEEIRTEAVRAKAPKVEVGSDLSEEWRR